MDFDTWYTQDRTLREAWEGKEGFDNYLTTQIITMRDCYARAMQACEVREPIAQPCAPWTVDNFY